MRSISVMGRAVIVITLLMIGPVAPRAIAAKNPGASAQLTFADSRSGGGCSARCR